MGNTKIEWTEKVWNPVRGCSKVSEGCRHCYAETRANRFCGPGLPYEGLVALGRWNGSIKFVENHLLDPLGWKKPSKIFVNSMSDLFHDNVTDAMLDKIFAVMALCPRHVFQILTKRPVRMQAYLWERAKSIRYWEAAARAMGYTFKFQGFDGKEHSICPFPLPNVWLGVSIEDQPAANIRVPLLLQTPAAVRIVSAEPLLGLIDLTRIDITEQIVGDLLQMHMRTGRTVDTSMYPRCWVNALTGETASGDLAPHLDWAICGGESGPSARPMHPRWARTLRDDCVQAGVPFFFKQHGEWMPVFTGIHPSDNDPKCRIHEGYTFPKIYESDAIGQHMWRVGKKGAGDRLDDVQWHQFPGELQACPSGAQLDHALVAS